MDAVANHALTSDMVIVLCLVGFATLGRYLGLWSPRHSSRVDAVDSR